MSNKRFIRRVRLGARYVTKHLIDRLVGAYSLDYSPLKPLDIVCERTYACNLKCQTCFRWTSIPNENELGLEDWKAVIKKMKNWIGTFSLSFTGGEPFLKEDMIDIIRFASENGIVTSVSSNGSLIDNALAERIISSGLDSLALSLNSLTPVIHNKTRGTESSFNEVMRAIQNLKKRGDMWLSICTTIMKENINDLAALAEFVRKEGLDGITFQPLMEAWTLPIFDEKGGSRKLPDGKFYSKLGKESEGIEDIFKQLVDMKVEGYPINNSIRHLRCMSKYLKNPKGPEISHIPCKIGSKNFLIDPFGNVRICSIMEPIGNIKEDSPRNIWNSKKALQERQKIRECRKTCRLLTCTFKELDLGFKVRKMSRYVLLKGA